MNKILLAFCVVLTCALSSHARTLKIEYIQDSISVSIADKGSYNDDIRAIIGHSIDSVMVLENPKLTQMLSHKLLIGNIELQYEGGGSMNLKEKLVKQLKAPITINDRDVLRAYRGEDLIQQLTFQKPLTVEDIRKNIKITPSSTSPKGKIELSQKNDTLRFIIENPRLIALDSIYVIDGETKDVIGSIKFETLRNTVVGIPTKLIGKKGDINVSLQLVSPEIPNKKIDLDGEYTVEIKDNDNLLSFIIGGAILLIVLIPILLTYRRKKKKEVSESEDKQGKTEEDKLFQDEKEKEVDRNKDDTQESGEGIKTDNAPSGEDKSTEGEEILKLQSKIKGLEEIIKNHTAHNQEYQKAIKDRDVQITKLNNRIESLSKQIVEYQKDHTDKKELREKINDLNAKIKALVNSSAKDKKELRECQSRLSSSESSKNAKDKRIGELTEEREKMSLRLAEEKRKGDILRNAVNNYSKQTHMLFLIDEALSIIDDSLNDCFQNVKSDIMINRLVNPIIYGTPGLDEGGVETYRDSWRKDIFDNPTKFFGKDVLMLSNDEVELTLREKFIEPLAMRDSFNKLVRLYLFTNVGWINEKMVEAGFDVDAIQTVFVEFKNLFSRFGVEVAYPHLFVDKFDDIKHRDSHRCEVFSLFEPTEAIRSFIHSQQGEDLIVDIVRIGLPQSSVSARRIPMVSLPNF